MEAQLESLPPVPDSPSPTDTATISWPSESSSSPPPAAQQDEDRALLTNEVVEAVTLAILDVQEHERQKDEEEHHQQHPSPLETTSRNLSPIETRFERGDQHSAGEELETPTQVFQTPISPSHTGVVGYQSPVEDEAAELPLLEALGETTAPLASLATDGQQDKFIPKVEDEQPKTEEKFQPKLEEQTEERFAPAVERELAVPGLAVTKPTMEMGGNEVVLSEEEIEEIQRSPIRAPGPMPFFRSLITVNTSPFTSEGDGRPIIYASPVSSSNAGPRTAISPPDGFGAGFWEESRAQQPTSEGEHRRQSHRQPVAIHPSIEHILVPTPVGVMTSEDESSSSSSSESDDPPPGRAPYPLTDPTSIASHKPQSRPFVHSTRPSPPSRSIDSRPLPPRKGQHASTTYPGDVPRVSGRTIVSSMVSNQRPAPISGVGARKAASQPPESSPRQQERKPSVDELIQLIKERLQDENSFRYVLKGVLVEHEEGRERSRREEYSKEPRSSERDERECRPVPIRKLSSKTPPSFFVQTDSESELEFDLGGGHQHQRISKRKPSPPRSTRQQQQRPRSRSRSRGPTSVPMTRSTVVPPAAFSALAHHQHLASLTPRRINPPPFHDPRDVAVAKPAAKSREQAPRRQAAPTSNTKSHPPPPPLVRPVPIHPLSTTLPPRTPSISPEAETTAFVPHSATVALEQLARQAEASSRGLATLPRKQGTGRSKSDREGKGRSGREGKERQGQHKERDQGPFYRANPPREKPQRRHTIDQVREIEERRKREGEEGMEKARERRERDLELKISRAGGSGVAQRRSSESKKHASPKKAPLLPLTNRLPPSSGLKSTIAAKAGRSSGVVRDAAGSRVWKRKDESEKERRETYHFASFSFDDFA